MKNLTKVLSTKIPNFNENGYVQPPLSPQAPSAIIEALVYRGIPLDLRARPEQSQHLSGALLPRWLQVVYRVSNGRPHRQLYTTILRLRKKRCDIWWNLSLWLRSLFTYRHLLNVWADKSAYGSQRVNHYTLPQPTTQCNSDSDSSHLIVGAVILL